MELWDYLSATPAVATQANKKTDVPELPSSVINDKIALPDFEKAKSTAESDSSNNVDFGKLIREKGYYGAFLAMNKKPDFDAEEKRLRRSRELTLLGDIANLGGQVLASGMGARRFAPIQSRVPHYTEKLQRLRDARRAYDVDFNNKSLSMIFQEYDRKRRNEAAQASADLKYKRDLTMKQIDQAFQIGMLDAKGKQALEQQAIKAKDAKELAALNHKYKLGEISTKANSNNAKVVDSVIGSDGNIYTRNTRLTPNEAQQIVLGSGMGEDDLAPFLTQEKDAFGNVIKTKTDWQAAAAYALQNGMVPAEELKSRGFKYGGVADKKVVAPWINNKSSNDKAPWLK